MANGQPPFTDKRVPERTCAWDLSDRVGADDWRQLGCECRCGEILASETKPLTDAPRLSAPVGRDTLEPSGRGAIARTGPRTIAVSGEGSA